MENKKLIFTEKTLEEEGHSKGSWKILIVDDEPDIHNMTKLALKNFSFAEQGLEFISAHSAEEAVRALNEHSNIAVVLLDVIMEEEDSGLQVVNYIRNVLGDKLCRVVLRTGHPGLVTEHEVISNYEINDFTIKSELTSQKLQSVLVLALRSYQELMSTQHS